MFLPRERLRQKYRTLDWPASQPVLSPHYRGRPLLRDLDCGNCQACLDSCPTGALARNQEASCRTPFLDQGKCIFCGSCVKACPQGAIEFTSDYHLAAEKREDLLARPVASPFTGQNEARAKKLPRGRGIFAKSFKLRQVSAGGCNACEADCNVLGTLVYDLGRFGVEFTASPRHADAIVLTGPVSMQMLPALLDAWESVPEPRLLIAVGTCAISGGLFGPDRDCAGGMDGLPHACAENSLDLPDDFRPCVYIPGCPPNPWTILDGLIRARLKA